MDIELAGRGMSQRSWAPLPAWGKVGRQSLPVAASFSLLLMGVATGCSSGGASASPSPPATKVVLSSSANPAVAGTPFTLTATLTPGAAQGGFEFADNTGKIGAVLLAMGSASLSVTPTQVGTVPYSATYSDAGGGSSLAATLNVAVSTAASASTCGLGTALLVLNGESASLADSNYRPAGDNQSAVCVEGEGGSLTLNNPTISKSGNGIVGTDPSGVNSAVLAFGASDSAPVNSAIAVSGGTIAAAGMGAYAAFSAGAGSSVTLSDTAVTANFNAVGASMAGHLALLRATVNSSGYPLVAINGSGSVTITDSTLTGLPGQNGSSGALQLFSNLVPGAESKAGSVSITGGSLTWSEGPLIVVTGSESAVVSLKNVALTQGKEFIFASGATGKISVLADGVAFGGSSDYQNSSVPASLSLSNVSTFNGHMSGASLTLDATSSWTLTSDDTVGAFSDAAGISGSTITNVVGNGYNATYDSANSPVMAGKTYSLAGGGSLAPR